MLGLVKRWQHFHRITKQTAERKADSGAALFHIRSRRIISSVFTFIELQPFTRVREAMLDDGEFARMQEYLMAHPQAGDVIAGSGGCGFSLQKKLAREHQG